MSKIEKLWPVVFLPIGLTVLLLSLSAKAQAFDANVFARAGVAYIVKMSDNGGICKTYTKKDLAQMDGENVVVEKEYSTGYLGYADAGFWFTPGAKIYILGGYSYAACTSVGEEYHGPMLGLRVGVKQYIEISWFTYKEMNEETGQEENRYAVRPMIGAKIDQAEINILAIVTKDKLGEKHITGGLGLSIPFNF